MTIIQPHRPKIMLDWLLVLLVAVLLVAAVGVVLLYNRLVGINHGIGETKARLKEAQAENAELKDKVFALLGHQNLEEFAFSRGLVKDRAPRYLEISHE